MISKIQINRSSLVGIVFFLVTGLIFLIYSIDFSPLVLAGIFLFYAYRFRTIEGLPSSFDLSLLGVIAFVISFFTIIVFKMSGYWIPAIGFVILVTLLFDNLELAFLFAVFIASLGASIDGGNFNVGISLFAGALTGAILAFRSRRRFRVIRAGFVAAAVQFLVAFIVEQEQSPLFISNVDFMLMKVCFLNGLISAMAVLGILPICEYIFKVVTTVSLLELSDFNHPLMQRLILEAPGTYQHSLVVANLSETAADAIGANALLARVGAYYHDVGKMLKPNYFIENQISYRDVHKDLKPSMSKLIILNHVKDGVELARKYHLNPRLIDFIVQHHGRSLIYFFYQRAKKLEPETEHEEEYRYPGPKPQTKETAIVSLADTVEALSRTLNDPTPSRIEEMVRESVRKKFMEGELDESDLTLKDLEKITQKFIHMLNAIFHTRINYPKDEDRNNKSAKDKEDKS